MGKWKIYKSFVEHYANVNSKPKKTDVVFYAFAKHLRDATKPVYDQHALRGLWAIDTKLTQQQVSICRNLLAKKNGRWKAIASGPSMQDGYRLYTERVIELCKGGASLDDLDKLLMPLGQAIKIKTASTTEFTLLVNCSE